MDRQHYFAGPHLLHHLPDLVVDLGLVHLFLGVLNQNLGLLIALDLLHYGLDKALVDLVVGVQLLVKLVEGYHGEVEPLHLGLEVTEPKQVPDALLGNINFIRIVEYHKGYKGQGLVTVQVVPLDLLQQNRVLQNQKLGLPDLPQDPTQAPHLCRILYQHHLLLQNNQEAPLPKPIHLRAAWDYPLLHHLPLVDLVLLDQSLQLLRVLGLQELLRLTQVKDEENLILDELVVEVDNPFVVKLGDLLVLGYLLLLQVIVLQNLVDDVEILFFD